MGWIQFLLNTLWLRRFWKHRKAFSHRFGYFPTNPWVKSKYLHKQMLHRQDSERLGVSAIKSWQKKSTLSLILWIPRVFPFPPPKKMFKGENQWSCLPTRKASSVWLLFCSLRSLPKEDPLSFWAEQCSLVCFQNQLFYKLNLE